MDLQQVRRDLAEHLGGSALPVVTDTKSAQPPCVLVGPVTQVEVETACAYQVTIPVMLIGRRPAGEANLAVIDAWLPQVLAAAQEVAEVSEALLGTIEVSQGDLPAYLIETVHVVKE